MIVDRSLSHFKKTPVERSLHELVEQQDEEGEDRPFSRPPSLEEHLLRQLHIEIEDEEKIKIGEWIIGSLDDDGYLPYSSQDIAGFIGIEDAPGGRSVKRDPQV